MGTILASAIINKAQIIAQDTTNIRWPATEWLGWLSDAQRVICAALPEISAVTGPVTLVAGTKQSLPAGGIELRNVTRNLGVGGTTPGMSIRKVPQDILDSQVPDWHTQTPVAVLRHFTYDPRAPRVFYVYPPSVASNVVEALYTTSPVDLATLSTAIAVDDIYFSALLDYILYRAYSKDIEIAGSADRANLHYGMFKDFMTVKSVSAAGGAPADSVRG